MDVGIKEDRKWKAQSEKLVCMPTQCYDAPSEKFGQILVVILSVELDRVRDRKWNSERVIIFQFVKLQCTQGVNNYAQIRKRIFFELTYGIVERLTSS